MSTREESWHSGKKIGLNQFVRDLTFCQLLNLSLSPFLLKPIKRGISQNKFRYNPVSKFCNPRNLRTLTFYDAVRGDVFTVLRTSAFYQDMYQSFLLLIFSFMGNLSSSHCPSWKLNKSLTGVPKHKQTNKCFNVVTLLIFREHHKGAIKYTPQLRTLSAFGQDIAPWYLRNFLLAAEKKNRTIFEMYAKCL